MLAQSMRPQLKADTHYIPVSEGVYLRRNNSRLTLKGKSLYFLLEHLAPNLNGQVTLEELTGELDAERKRMITTLLEKLFARDFLHDASQDQAHTLHPADLATYAPDIAFIESFQPAAAHRFERFQETRLLLIGSGSGFASLLQASAQAGIKKIAALSTPEEVRVALDTGFSEPIAAHVTQVIDASAWENEAELQRIIRDHDAILHIVEQPLLARAQMLNRLCRAEQKTLLQAVVVDDYAWLGPLVSPTTDGCWECAWRRLQANATSFTEQPEGYAFVDQFQAVRSQFLNQPEATMIAHRLLFSLFQHITQAGSSETARRLASLDLATYASEGHTFQPHPHCQACQPAAFPTAAQFLAQIHQLQAQAPLEAETLLNNLETCIDEKLGLFTAFDTRNFVQAPLAVYQMQLSHPALPESQAASLSAVAVSTDTREAVLEAAYKACELYATSLVDRRLLLTEAQVQEQAASVPVIRNAELYAGVEPLAIAEDMWSWAQDLHTQQVALVPASRVFSVPGKPGHGLAAGKSWEEALCLALLDWGRELTLKELQDTPGFYPQVELEQTSLTAEGDHLYHLLKATGGQVVVYDITASLQVPTFVFCFNGKAVACSAHCDVAQALSQGLEQTLQQYQSEQFHQPEYALAALPSFPEHLRGVEATTPSTSAPEGWAERLAWLLQHLQADDVRAFVVPLHHDPALARTLPFVVRVLLSGREWKKGA